MRRIVRNRTAKTGLAPSQPCCPSPAEGSAREPVGPRPRTRREPTCPSAPDTMLLREGTTAALLHSTHGLLPAKSDAAGVAYAMRPASRASTACRAHGRAAYLAMCRASQDSRPASCCSVQSRTVAPLRSGRACQSRCRSVRRVGTWARSRRSHTAAHEGQRCIQRHPLPMRPQLLDPCPSVRHLQVGMGHYGPPVGRGCGSRSFHSRMLPLRGRLWAIQFANLASLISATGQPARAAHCNLPRSFSTIGNDSGIVCETNRVLLGIPSSSPILSLPHGDASAFFSRRAGRSPPQALAALGAAPPPG